ncbi:YheC/YheD family protein [Paenibacillus gansuensis]|uniref:YheC/YheD family protein n=1 Tax=Paenibacillus gansuensis TaxID=306542 RepID=A0ABW5PD07_9BACL
MIVENRMIGILVNQSLYKRIPAGKTGHEMLSFYEEAAKEHGLQPAFISLENGMSRNGMNGMVRAYVRVNGNYVQQTIPVPKVIHNRALYFQPSMHKRMEKLRTRGTVVYNQRNRYGKMQIHRLLLLNEELRPHVPVSYVAGVEAIRSMMKTNRELIIKPNNSSIGRGVMKLQSTARGWKLSYPVHRNSSQTRSIYLKGKLPLLLRRRIRRETYLVQQCIPLAAYQGRPFDLRVSVQRNRSGIWQVTGIIGKVAAKQKFVTNVAKGGSVQPLNELLSGYPELQPDQVRWQIESLSLRIAEHLSLHLPQLADIGLDIGITETGFPMFIECNGRDQRYSFGEGNLMDEWKATYANPIAYGKFLMEQTQ